MNDIKISIVMPVFNNESTLRRALDSVLSQNCPVKFELIAAIDPSKDHSLEILREYSRKDARIIVLASKERLGTGLSRKKAIERSHGEYIYFLDADDKLRNDCLKTLYEAITKNEADLVNCGFYVIYGKNERRITYPFRRNAVLTKKKALDAYYMDACLRGFMWTKMYRKEILLSSPQVLLTSPKDMFEDQALNGTLIAKCQKVVLISKPLYYYYKNIPNSLSSEKRTDRAMRHLGVFALQRLFYERTGDALALHSFSKHLFRQKMTLDFDRKIDKRNGADKEYLKRVSVYWKEIKNLKKPLPLMGRDYEELMSRAFID